VTIVVPPQACNLPVETIEGFAERVFARLGIEPGADESEFVQSIGGRICRADIFSHSLVVRGPGRFDVYVPQTCGIFDTRHLVARALGHYILHFPRIDKLEGYEMQVPRKLSGNATWEAGVFALAFLVPSDILRAEMARSNNILVDVASILRVSHSLVHARVNQLGLLAA
jgi:hypothetical protein